MRAAEVDVEVLVDVEGGVVHRVGDLPHHRAGGGRVAGVVLRPGVPARVAVAGSEDAVSR